MIQNFKSDVLQLTYRHTQYQVALTHGMSSVYVFRMLNCHIP